MPLQWKSEHFTRRETFSADTARLTIFSAWRCGCCPFTKRSKKEAPARETGSEEARSEETKSEETREEESPQARNAETEAPRQEGEHNAFEDSPGVKPTDQALIDAVDVEATNRIANNSNTKNGPCLTGTYEPITGKRFFGENFLKNRAGK